jgi:transposase
MIQTLFTNKDAVFQDGFHVSTAGTVQSWIEEHEDEHHVPLPAHSSHLNAIETHWSVLETRVKNRFPPPKSLKQLEDVLQEEWYKIPLETVQSQYESIPRNSGAVLKEESGRTPY